MEAAEKKAHPIMEDAGALFLQVPVKRSLGTLILTIIEAVCLFVISAAQAGIVLGPGAAVFTGWALFLHRDSLRIPILLFAIALSLINLFVLWRGYRLRNSPAAAWRKRPLTRKEQWRIGVVLTFSLLTLAIAWGEIYFHRLLHHSII